MSKRNYRDMAERQWGDEKFVCVGLDSDTTKIPIDHIQFGKGMGPSGSIVAFNERIVQETYDVAFAYKPNLAFYLGLGDQGVSALRSTVRIIQKIAPKVPIILDAKWADIGNTNVGYAKFAFEYLGVDAVTVNPYLGMEALEASFLSDRNKGVFVLCRTSNAGALEFQNWDLIGPDMPDRRASYMPVYQYVARRVAREWNKLGNCGVVVGATAPGEQLREVRRIVGDMPILIPGVGAQGGDLEANVREGKNRSGKGIIVNLSRSVLYAGNGPDFASKAREEVLRVNGLINQYR